MAWKILITGQISNLSSGGSPTVITTTYPHGLMTGDAVVITGTDIDGSYTVFFSAAPTTFSVLATSSGGTSGTFYGGNQRAFLDSISPTSISMPINERATMRFSMIDQIPALLGEVTVYAQDGSTKLFGGVLTNRRTRSFDGRSLSMFVDCTCGDFSTYADYCYQSKVYSTGPTLEDVLDDLVADKLGAYGIAVHASQVTGPTLDAFTWTRKRVSDCLRELSSKTGYAYRIDADKKLRMFVPGTDAAPYTVTAGTPNVEDIVWEDAAEPAATDIYLDCGPDGTDEVTQVWIQAGGATSWVAPISVAHGFDGPGTVLVNGVTKTVGTGAQYEWDPDTATLTLGTDSTPTNGWEIELVYVGQFPFTVTATTGGSPVVEVVRTRTDIKHPDAAQEVVDGLLDELAQQPRTITMPSTQIGWLPGQEISIVHSSRDIDDTDATITNVEIQLISDDFWRYQITAQETTTPQASYLQQWRELLAGVV